MSALAVPSPSLPATKPETLEKLQVAYERMMQVPDVDCPMQHDIHAGMYARTLTMPPWTSLLGALIKVPTLVTTVGSGITLNSDEQWVPFDGYRIWHGDANRKAVFITNESPLIITMTFPTDAKTVEEAEEAFTDEAELLQSRRSA